MVFGVTIVRKPAHVVIEGHVTRRPELVSVDPDIKDGTVPKVVKESGEEKGDRKYNKKKQIESGEEKGDRKYYVYIYFCVVIYCRFFF